MAAPTIAGLCVHDGLLAACWETEFKTAAGYAWRQDPAGSTDPASTSRPQIRQQTPWIQLAGPLGNQRVRRFWLLGTFPSTAEIEITYDYSDSIVETKSGFGTGAAGQIVEVQLPRQDCHAARLLLRGHTRLVCLRAECEVEKGTYRRTAART